MARFIQEGMLVDYTPATAVAAGAVVAVGGTCGIADRPIAAGTLGALTVCGVYEVPKAEIAFAAGDGVYWDVDGDPYGGTAGSGCATTVAAGNLFMGYVVPAGAAAATASTVRVSLGSGNNSRLFTQTAASAACTNTATETLFDKQLTLPANSLKAGDVLRIRAQGLATATNGTDTLTIALYLGGLSGIAVCTTGAVDVANNDLFYIDAQVVIRTVGASGTLVGCGLQALGVPGTVTAKPFLLASTAVDTTAEKVIGVSAKWSAANAGNSCRLDVLTVEKVGT